MTLCSATKRPGTTHHPLASAVRAHGANLSCLHDLLRAVDHGLHALCVNLSHVHGHRQSTRHRHCQRVELQVNDVAVVPHEVVRKAIWPKSLRLGLGVENQASSLSSLRSAKQHAVKRSTCPEKTAEQRTSKQNEAPRERHTEPHGHPTIVTCMPNVHDNTNVHR